MHGCSCVKENKKSQQCLLTKNPGLQDSGPLQVLLHLREVIGSQPVIASTLLYPNFFRCIYVVAALSNNSIDEYVLSPQNGVGIGQDYCGLRSQLTFIFIIFEEKMGN